MAGVKHQGSSSSSVSHCKYQVFLSFRGKDTRKNFTDHLYKALVQAGIHTFRDDDEIRRGETIKLEIRNAIQQSKILIIVFSKNYASSRWCLDELAMIMQHRRTAGYKVLPLFYDVEPSHIRNQTGSFAKAFVEHEIRFREEMERVNGWRIALKEVADLGGMELGDGYEAQFVQSIVKEVSKKLDRAIFHIPLDFIGRDSLINYINSWLQDGSNGNAICILYGIGGVGKTIIAKSVYNQNIDKFEGTSFLANVTERSKEPNGLVCLQRQLLLDILNKINVNNEIHDVDEGIMKIKDAICCRRTLIVLDDVNERDQLKAIIGEQNWLCKASKIIVTTRNKGLNIDVPDHECLQCKVEPLDKKKSVELFSWHAFGQAHPRVDFVKYSTRIVQHCNGLPLALRVIGSSLSGKSIKVWESALQEMEAIPNCEVQKVLRASYDSLDDDYQKNLFLDIACFFIGMDEDYAVRIVDGLGLGATFRIDNLINRCLLDIDKEKRLWMHQLIRDMGRDIARQESPKCQRIWHHMEAFMTLKETSQDTEKVRGLTLDMHGLMDNNCTKVAHGEDALETSLVCHQHKLSSLSRGWFSNFFFGNQAESQRTSIFPKLGTDSFGKMHNVKFLQLNYLKFNGSYEDFPKNLIWLCWHGFSLKSIPKDLCLCLEKLAVLDLRRSSLVDAWNGKISFPKLKILDLSHSYLLIRTPDLSGLLCLEKLMLEDCIHLLKIHESIGDLHSLVILNLRNCKSLVELPEEVIRLNSLQELDLYGCSNLDGVNYELAQLQRHSLFHRDGIVALPLKFFFQSWFSTMKSSRITSFSLPFSLLKLDLSGTPIRSLPKSITSLSTLNVLLLRNCQMLRTLLELPSNLARLSVSFCFSLQTIPALPCYIHVHDCEKLFHVQDLFKLELIQKASLPMFRIMETVIAPKQPIGFQILLKGNIFHVLLPGSELSRFYKEGDDEWIIQNEFQEYFSFKISSSAEHRICGLKLFTKFSATSKSELKYPFFFELKNNTKGRTTSFSPRFIPIIIIVNGTAEFLMLSHWKCEGELDNGDELSVSMRTDDPSTVQIKTVGVRVLYEEEGNDHNEVMVAQSSSYSWDNQSLGDEHEHVAKTQIGSYIFSNYYCSHRYNVMRQGLYLCVFVRKNRGTRE